MRFTSLLAVLGLTMLLSACTGTRDAVPGFGATESPKAAPASVDTKDTKDNSLLVMDLNQLGKNLVWSIWLERVDGSLYPGLQSGIPSESLFVNFALSADKKFVHLLEMKQNSADPRGANLIDRFPVTSLGEENVTFDFSQGVSRRFFRSFIQPKNSSEFNYVYSSVYDFQNFDNVVTFAQLLKLTDAKSSSLIMHHAFRLADDTNGFVPVTVVQPLKLGIMPATFTSDPASAEPVAIRKWDTRKPINFYISSNTPAEYVPYLIEGMKWWNIALGTDFIQVEVLSHPVSWSDARINIVQWSDDATLCGSASAIGPSEANPVTGQIYSGKVLLCGRTLLPLFDLAVVPGSISREDFVKKLMMWTIAHEMGHVLGYSHNFAGKLYRDQAHPEILNSTVMDYPYAAEIPAYNSVGPADVAKIAVSYLQNADALSVRHLATFAYCSDEESAYKPDCSTFAPGGMTPSELSDRYLKMLADGTPFPVMENAVRKVILKQLFFVGDAASTLAAARLLKTYPGNKTTFVQDFANIAEATRPYFMLLPEDKQLDVFKTVSECILNCGYDYENQKGLLNTIGKTQTLAGFKTLQTLDTSVGGAISNASATPNLSNFYRLRENILELLENFWK